MNTTDVSRPRRRRLSARRLQLLGAAGLLAYVILSTSAAFVIAGPTTNPTRELFPFFSWSLFSKINDQRREYYISIVTLNGQTFDPPVDMRDIDDFTNPGDTSGSLRFKALQNVGKALTHGWSSAETKREQFAARFLGRHDVDYLISQRRYNPLQHWREGPAGDEVEEIGRFHHKGRT